MISEDRLRGLSPSERRDLLCALVRLEDAEAAPAPGRGRARAVWLAVTVASCACLAVWIAVLALTLPRYYRSGDWRGAWVGFDFALLVAFSVTGWAAWRRRQLLIVCLIVLATLLCCDAWFDVVLNTHTHNFIYSFLSAVLIELPLAATAIIGARRLLRQTSGRIRLLEGIRGPVPRLRNISLVGADSADRLADLFRHPAGDRPAGSGKPGSGANGAAAKGSVANASVAPGSAAPVSGTFRSGSAPGDRSAASR